MLPEKGELVVAKIREVFKAGVFCNLVEYENHDAFIHISEIASKWVRNVRDFVKEDQLVVAKVIRLDPEKNQVDLSIKNVSEYEKRKGIDAYQKEIRAEKLLGVLSKKCGISEDAIKKIVDALTSKYDDLYSSFEEISEKGEDALKGLKLDKKTVSAIVDLAKSNIKKKEVQLSGVIEIKVFDKNGLSELKNGFQKLIEETPSLEIKYVSAPKYEMNVTSKELKTADKELQLAVEKAKKIFGKHFVGFEKKRAA